MAEITRPETLANRGWLTMQQAVEAIGVSRRTLTYWVKEKRVETKKIGGTRWVRLPKEMR